MNDQQQAAQLRNEIRMACERYPLKIALNALAAVSAAGICLAGRAERSATVERFRRVLDHNIQIVDSSNLLSADTAELQ